MIKSWRHYSYSFREGKGRERWETPETWEGAERPGMGGKKAKLSRLWARKRVGGKWAGVWRRLHASFLLLSFVCGARLFQALLIEFF